MLLARHVSCSALRGAARPCWAAARGRTTTATTAAAVGGAGSSGGSRQAGVVTLSSARSRRQRPLSALGSSNARSICAAAAGCVCFGVHMRLSLALRGDAKNVIPNPPVP
jgi:hypothetical protein